MTAPPELWTCLSCAKERGYRHPNPEGLEHTLGRCAFCFANTLVVRLEDLFPAEDDIPYE
jgi:hypothetical protein